jgi:hypothetical protein
MRGPAAACFGGSPEAFTACALAGSFATGLSACPQAGMVRQLITKKMSCFMDLPCFHETIG